jgi:hypothetical protein
VGIIVQTEKTGFQVPEEFINEETYTANAAYRYERSDGTVETAESIEDAMRKCPVLGGMALEQASVLLELAAIGKAKLAEEAKYEEPKPHEPIVSFQKEPASTMRAEKTPPAHLPTRDNVERPTRGVEEMIAAEVMRSDQMAATISVEQTTMERHLEATPAPWYESKKVSSRPPAKIPEDAHVTIITEQDDGLIRLVMPELAAPQPDKPMSLHVAEMPDNTSGEENVWHGDTTDIDSKYDEGTVLNGLVEEDFEPKVLGGVSERTVADTFRLIMALVDNRAVSEESSIASQSIDTLGPMDHAIGQLSLEGFEQKIDGFEIPPSLHAIKQQAEEQPLEVTLIELASYVKLEVKDRIDDSILDVLQRLDDALIASGMTGRELPPDWQLTPEITRQLLTLIAEIGYEDSPRVLTEFVTRHDMEFLVQAVRLLTQLANEDNQQEFLQYKPRLHNLTANVEPAVARWGRAIFGLFKMRSTNLELVGAE